jgi:hypothetical protein
MTKYLKNKLSKIFTYGNVKERVISNIKTKETLLNKKCFRILENKNLGVYGLFGSSNINDDKCTIVLLASWWGLMNRYITIEC